MKNYKLKVYGWEIDGSGHWLSDGDVQELYEYMEEEGVDELDDLYDLDTFYYDDKNSFYVSALQRTDRTHFELVDEEGNVVLDFEEDAAGELDWDNVDYSEDEETLWGFPSEHTPYPNIIIDLYENKGLVCEYNFTEEDDSYEPKPEDFSFLYNLIETPDGDYDYLGQAYYKHNKMNLDYDETSTSGKGRTVELYRAEDYE